MKNFGVLVATQKNEYLYTRPLVLPIRRVYFTTCNYIPDKKAFAIMLYGDGINPILLYLKINTHAITCFSDLWDKSKPIFRVEPGKKNEYHEYLTKLKKAFVKYHESQL